MRLSSLIAMAFVISASGIASIAAAQTPAPDAGAPAIAQEAERLLQQMGAYLGSAQQFTFRADITFDHVLPSGQKLQFSATQDVALQRPGRLYVEWAGDLGSRQFWYDGKSITLYAMACWK